MSLLRTLAALWEIGACGHDTQDRIVVRSLPCRAWGNLIESEHEWQFCLNCGRLVCGNGVPERERLFKDSPKPAA